MIDLSSEAAGLGKLIEQSGLSISEDDRSTVSGSGVDDPFTFEPQRAVEVLAGALVKVHATALSGSEMLFNPAAVVAAVASRSNAAGPEAELSDTELSDTERSGPLGDAYSHMSRADLFELLAERADLIAARSSRQVLSQGRPVLSNLFFRGTELVGFSDWSRAAVADPHLDLALACRDLLERFGAAPVREFLTAYGSDSIDPVRLDWFSLAVELSR